MMDASVDFSSIISPLVLKKYIEFWINEDLPNFDLSTIVITNDYINANIEIKEAGIIAGLPFAEAVIKYCDCQVDWKFKEGEQVDKAAIIGVINGPARRIVMAERTALNILSRACGVATIARKLALKLKPKWKGELAGNRKTTPGFRIVEKYAMMVGGVSTHRYDLSSMVMVKDNHVRASEGIDKSVKLLRAKIGNLMKIEVECGDANEAIEAAKSGADIVMLDNFAPHDIRTVSKQVKNINPTVLIEASGGINENNIMDYAIENVDVISSSLFSQGYKCIDISINTVSVEPTITDNSESPKITNHQPVEEKTSVSADKSETDSSSVVPKTNESIEREKFATKRKHEETSVVTADKPNTIINKVAESPTLDKINSANKPINKQHPNKMSVNRYESPAAKQRKSNPNGKSGQTIYNLQTVGSVRMPGQPVRFDGKGPNSNRANMDNQANFIRTMAANLVLQLQNNQNNHPPFMNPNTMRFGGPIPRVPFMNNVKFFCKACNIQNPNAFCQMCRKKLE